MRLLDSRKRVVLVVGVFSIAFLPASEGRELVTIHGGKGIVVDIE